MAGQIAKKYASEDCVAVALSDGGVLVGMQIAMKLRCLIMMMLTEDVELPKEPDPIGGITQDGSFTYNHRYTDGDIEELSTEYHNFIEQEKMHRVHEMHRAAAQGVLFRRELVEDKVIILVTDGLQDGFSLDMAIKFLKPVRTKKLLIAAPLASVPAVDRMHIQTDEIFCLNVVKDYISTDHYYDAHDVPPHEVIVKTIDQMVKAWE